MSRLVTGHLSLAILIGALCACASPRVSPTTEAAEAPIIAAGGAVSAPRGERIVGQRLDRAQDTDHVRELIEAFRAQSRTPLVAGNREQLFERDLKATHELTLERWRQRPLSERLKEFGSSLFSYWL